jgi:hypothetical protein
MELPAAEFRKLNLDLPEFLYTNFPDFPFAGLKSRHLGQCEVEAGANYASGFGSSPSLSTILGVYEKTGLSILT